MVTSCGRPVTLRRTSFGVAHASSPHERLAELCVNLPSPLVSDGTFGGALVSDALTNLWDQVVTDANRRPSVWGAGGVLAQTPRTGHTAQCRNGAGGVPWPGDAWHAPSSWSSHEIGSPRGPLRRALSAPASAARGRVCRRGLGARGDDPDAVVRLGRRPIDYRDAGRVGVRARC